MKNNYKEYLISYNFEGEKWVFQIYAKSFEEAKRRLNCIKYNSHLDGELVIKIPVPNNVLKEFFYKLFKKNKNE